MSEDLLPIAGLDPLFEGKTRRCYRHPHDGTRLLKVIKPDWEPETVRRRADRRYRRLLPLRYHDIQRREIETYRHFERRLGDRLRRFIPQVHGFARTDLGPALMVEFARNHDGTPCYVLEELALSGAAFDVSESLNRLLVFLDETGIPVHDRNPDNIVYTRNETGRLDARLIDGFGSEDVLPLWRWSAACARLRMRGSAERFRRNIDRRLALALGVEAAGG